MKIAKTLLILPFLTACTSGLVIDYQSGTGQTFKMKSNKEFSDGYEFSYELPDGRMIQFKPKGAVTNSNGQAFEVMEKLVDRLPGSSDDDDEG